MASNFLPRYVLLASMLAIVVVGAMAAMFYGQYRWLASEIVQTGAEQHEASLAESFSRRARGQLHRITDDLSVSYPGATQSNLRQILASAILESDDLIGLRLELELVTVSSGTFDDVGVIDSLLWQPDNLYMRYPLTVDDIRVGVLFSNFSLDVLQIDAAAFRNNLLEKEIRKRQTSYIWIGIATLVALSLSGLVIWLIARTQTARIRELKHQAERLSDSDFGEPLAVIRGDELGELADVFNRMRDKLRVTTISRDYVDRVLAGMNEAIIITSPDGTIKRVNAATAKLLGYGPEDLPGQSLASVVDTKNGPDLRVDHIGGVPQEAVLLTRNGDSVPVSYTGSVISGDGGGFGDHVYAAQNITERRKAEKRIRYLARIDALTKVPNRMQFQHLLQRAIAKAKRSNNMLCLMYIDVDHFKEINDTFGHLAGDATLETVADRLSAALPKKSVIGRLAGDEFAVIVDKLNADKRSEEAVTRLARTLLDKLADPFYVQGHEVFMTASMGIAYYPDDAANVIDLIRNADAALYHAKKNGGNIFSSYSPEMNEAAVERLMTKSKLKRAFERDELLVHYQPKYNIKTGEVFGAEALVRWELPERGIILPSDFIPIAEETNLIIEIGEWVLDRVCEDFRYWQRCVSNAGRISVNLSLKQLKQANFINRISSILRSYELSPTSLELEITETTLMEDPARTIKLLDELYSLGLHLAIDDFGTGYSSLSALQQFPISTLKIDKSFVKDVAINNDDATIVGTIIHMGRSMHMDVVAEGVESEDQLNFLQTLDCTYVQGLLFGDPMSSDNYLELLLAQAEGTDQHRALFA